VPTLFSIEYLHDYWHISYLLSYKESMLAVLVLWLSATALVSKSQSIQDVWCNSYLNTFTAIVDLSRFNNSRLKLPASTLVNQIFQSHSFSLNQLNCHYRRETCTAASVYLADIIFIPFIVYYSLHCDIMNPCLSLCSEGEWAVSDCSL